MAVTLGILVALIFFGIALLILILTNAPNYSNILATTTTEATFSWPAFIVGLILGPFLGGVVGAKVSKENKLQVAGVIGLALAILVLFLTFNTLKSWIVAVLLLSVFLLSFLGGVVMSKSA